MFFLGKLLRSSALYAEKCFSDEAQEMCLSPLWDQSSAAVDNACWSVTGCAVTTDPASAQEPLMT